MHAVSRPADDTTAEAHRWTVEADDYDAALAEVQPAVPDGFVLLSVQVEHPDHA
jgi:UDP-N-acetylmuramate-alanine ligase